MDNKKGFALYYFICFTLFSVITPNLQLFLEHQGWDYTMIGILQGFYQLVGVAGPMLIGGLADRSGRYRPFLFLGYLLMIPGFYFLGLSSSLILSLSLIGLIGIALKSIVPLSDTLLSHSLENPEEDYGKLRVWGSIGFLACSLFLDYSGILEKEFQRSFLLMIYITTGFSLLSLLVLPASKSASAKKEVHRDDSEKILPIFWLIMVILFIAWFANSAYFSFYSLYLRELTSIGKINIQWGLGALFEIPLMFLSGVILRRTGMKRLLLFTLLVTVIRFLLYYLTRNPIVLTLSQMLHGVTFGLLHSISVAVVNRFVPSGKKASSMALYSAVVRGGSAFLGSALGGWISQHYGLASLFGIYGLIPLVSMAILLFIPAEKMERKKQLGAL